MPLALRKAIEKGLGDKAHLVTFEIIINSDTHLNTVYIKDKDQNSQFNFCITDYPEYEEFIAELWVEPLSEHNILAQTTMIRDYSEVVAVLRKWILLIEKYNEHSHLFDNFIDNFSKIDFDEKGEFTQEEKQQVKLVLNELKTASKVQLELDDTQFKLLSDRLDYLAEAVERSNKFDWKNIAMGSIASAVVALSLDTTKGQLLWKLFVDLLKNIPNLLPN